MIDVCATTGEEGGVHRGCLRDGRTEVVGDEGGFRARTLTDGRRFELARGRVGRGGLRGLVLVGEGGEGRLVLLRLGLAEGVRFKGGRGVVLMRQEMIWLRPVHPSIRLLLLLMSGSSLPLTHLSETRHPVLSCRLGSSRHPRSSRLLLLMLLMFLLELSHLLARELLLGHLH